MVLGPFIKFMTGRADEVAVTPEGVANARTADHGSGITRHFCDTGMLGGKSTNNSLVQKYGFYQDNPDT